MIELDVPNVQVNFYQVKADGTPDTAKPCALVAVGCLAVVSFEATYRPITPIISNLIYGNGVTFKATSILRVENSCPLDPTRRRRCRALSEAAMTVSHVPTTRASCSPVRRHTPPPGRRSAARSSSSPSSR